LDNLGDFQTIHLFFAYSEIQISNQMHLERMPDGRWHKFQLWAQKE
jgi:hypothetical protein